MKSYVLLLVVFALAFCIFLIWTMLNYFQALPFVTEHSFDVHRWIRHLQSVLRYCALHEPCDVLVICLPEGDCFTELVERSCHVRYGRDKEERRNAESLGKIKVCIKSLKCPGCTPKIHNTKEPHKNRYCVVSKPAEFNWTHWSSIFTTYYY